MVLINRNNWGEIKTLLEHGDFSCMYPDCENAGVYLVVSPWQTGLVCGDHDETLTESRDPWAYLSLAQVRHWHSKPATGFDNSLDRCHIEECGQPPLAYTLEGEKVCEDHAPHDPMPVQAWPLWKELA